MYIQFLGTGAGMPSKTRNVTAAALSLLDEIGEVWLFDCGEGTQHQLLHTSIRPRRICKLFVSHLHGDHIYGIPGFLGSRSFLGGTEPLTVYGPKGIKQFIDVSLRISKTHLTYPLHIIEFEEDCTFTFDAFHVHIKKLDHVIDSYGFRVEQLPLPGQLNIEKALALGVPKGPMLGALKNGQTITLDDGRIIKSSDVVLPPQKGFCVTILGDTRYCEASIALSEQADIVVHEATFDQESAALAQQYGHATNVEAALVAQQAQAQHVILTHISARFTQADTARLLEQAQQVFANSYVAHDFDLFHFEQSALHQTTAFKA